MLCNKIIPLTNIRVINTFTSKKVFKVKDYSKSVLNVKNINCQVG